MSLSYFHLIVGWLLILLGLIFISLVILNAYYYKEIENWNVVKGTVLQTKLTKKVVRFGGLDDFGMSTDISYSISISYQYEFDGQQYTSKKIFYYDFNRWFMFNKAKINLNNSYKTGQAVDVYVSSKKPESGFLIRKAPWVLMLTYAVICIIFGIIFLVN